MGFISDHKASTGDRRSDEAIAFELGQRVEQEGRPDIFEQYPDFRDEYYAVKRQLRDGPMKTLGTALKVGVLDRIPEMGMRLGEMTESAGAALLPDIQTPFGSPKQTALKAADYFSEQAQREQTEGNDRGDPFGVRSFEEVQTPADLGNFAARVTGENAPQLALSFVPGAIAGRIAQAGKLLQGATALEAAAAGLKSAQSIAYVSSALQNTADIYGNLDPEARRSGKGLAAAAGGGALAGVLDSLAELPLMSRLFPALEKKFVPPIVLNVLRRGGVTGALANAGATGLFEGTTEAVQEAIAVASEEYANGRDYPPDVIRSRLLNAGAGGAILGVGLGGVSGAIPGKPALSEEQSLRAELAAPLTPPAAPAAPVAPPAVEPGMRDAFVAKPPAYNAMAADTSMADMQVSPASGRLSLLGNQVYEAHLEEIMAADEALQVAQKIMSQPTSTFPTEVPGVTQPKPPADTSVGAPLMSPGVAYEPQELTLVSDLRNQARSEAIARSMLDADGEGSTPPSAPASQAKVSEVVQRVQSREEQIANSLVNTGGGQSTAPVASPAAQLQTLIKDTQKKAGWNPKWPFIPQDFGNRTFVEGVLADSTISEKDKAGMFLAAKNLGVGGTIQEARAIVSKAPVAQESAPLISTVKYVGPASPLGFKNAPLNALLFTQDDGDSAHRISSAAGSSVVSAAEKGVRRAVLLLDKASGKVYSRLIWSKDANSKMAGQGIRIADSQRKTYSGEPGYKKGGRSVDFEGGDESAPWSLLESQQFNGTPRFEVLGYLHWDKPQTEASRNFKSIDDLQNNPAMNRVLKRNFQPEPNKAVAVEAAKKLQRGTAEGRLRIGSDVDVAPGQPGVVKSDPRVSRLEAPVTEGTVVGDALADDKAKSPSGSAEASSMNDALLQLDAYAKSKGKKTFEFNLMVEKFVRENSKGLSEAKVPGMVAYFKGILGTPKMDNYVQRLTTRTADSYVMASPQAQARFMQGLSAIQASGVDVIAALPKLIEAITGEAKARGVTITKQNGQAIIGLAIDWHLGGITQDDVVRLFHEGAHPFIDGLPQWQQQAYQAAISQLPWYEQGWVRNGLGMDPRLLANTPREELGPVEQAIYDRMTPEELTVLRGTDPSILSVERAVEHLATIGVDSVQARDIISQIIRFVKGVMLRVGIELQRMLKGDNQVSETLVRAFVENKWLQFINRDFANSNGAIAVNLKQFLGVPTTQTDRLMVYDNINGESQNYYYDPKTGRMDFIAPSEGTTQSVTDYIARIITEKNLGSIIASAMQKAGVPVEALETLSNGIPMENLTTEQQTKLLTEAQRQIEAVQLEYTKDGKLMAPNKQPSKLNELQWRIARTQFFKNWFGDWQADPANASKVIDPETGEPRVVFHGTPNEFEEFKFGRDLGFHFGTTTEANERLQLNRPIMKQEEGGTGEQVIPAFLSIKNPALLSDGDWAFEADFDRLLRLGILEQRALDYIKAAIRREDHESRMKQALMDHGYDGAMYRNVVEGTGEQLTYIAFYPQQIKTAYNRTFTPSAKMQLTMRASESLDPTVEANTQFASVNHVSSVVANIMNDPEVARTLPTRYTKAGQSTVEQLIFGISAQNNTEVRKAALVQEMQNSKSFVSNQPFSFNPETKINDLPVGGDGSSAQQKAMRDSLLDLHRMEGATLRRIERMRERKSEIEAIRKEKKREVTVAETNELDRLNTDIPAFERMLNLKDVGLHDQILRMQGKLQVALLFDVVAGAEYVVPPGPHAQETAVLASKAKVPANLYFETPARQEFSRNLGKMQLWLANEDNRKNGWLYETVATQFRKLSEVNLAPTYDAASARFKKTAFDSISSMLRGIGTPQAKFLSSRFYSLENVVQRHTADMEVIGGKWSSIYDASKRAVNFSGQDPEFRDQYYNRLMQLLSATPDGTTDPFNKVIDVFNSIRPDAYKIKDAAKPAFRELLRSSVEAEKAITKIFVSLGLKVEDEGLGADEQGRQRQRGLIREGIITGRLSVSKSLDTIWEEMKPIWIKTDNGPSLLRDAAALWKEQRDVFTQLAKQYFSPAIKQDFVEPLIYSNKQYFTSIRGADTGTRVMVPQANVRLAWNTARESAPGGDMDVFIRELNRLEGGNAATESDMAGQVMHSLRIMFAKVNGVANERAQSKVSGIPVLPREMMNARTAEDFPPEWIDYALYDRGSNKVALHSMALNNAFGRDGLTSGEFAKNMASVATELDAIRREYTKWRKEVALNAEQTREKMGADRYRIALDSQDHQYLLNNISEKMRYLVNPISTQLGDLRLADEMVGLSALGTLQNVRSSLVNTTDVFGALYRTKFSSTSLRAVRDAIKYTAADGASALLEMFGVHTHFMAEFARKNRDLGAKDPDNFLSWRDHMTDYGTGNALAPGDDTQSRSTRTQNAGILIARRAKALVNANPSEMIGELSNKAMKTNFIPSVSGDAALSPKLRLMGIFKASAMWLTNGAVYGQYNAYKDLVMRGMEFINHSNNPKEYAQRLMDGEMTLDPATLGYTRKFMVMNDKAAWDYMADSINTKMNEGSVERMVASAWFRTQADPNQPVITDEQFGRIRGIALSDVQLNSMTTNLPADWRSNPMLRAMGVFISWPYMAMVRFPSLFQNAQGKYTLEAAMDGMLTMLIPIIPLTLAASMGVDWYDEYALGKKQNLRDIGADSLVPGLAPFAYPMATLERLARYGTGGLASEIVNATLNFDDARGGLSADSRVFLLSQLKNFRYTVGNLWQTEHIDYKGVIRPMLQFLGGNGVLQYAQLANRALGMNNAESAINERISIANYLRAVGRDLNLSVIPSKSSGQGIPNKATPFIGQMELAAYQDDTAQFKDAFAEAVRAYREEHPAEIDPAKAVIRSFQSRHPLRRVFRVTPTAGEYRLILENLSDPGREAVDSGVKQFNKYLLKLGAKPFDGKNEGSTFERLEKRMQASSAGLASSQLVAAEAAYADAFGN